MRCDDRDPWEGRLPWERGRGETQRQYAAFLAYLELSPEIRSLRKTAEAIGHKSATRVGKWAQQNQWERRADAWDVEQLALRAAQRRRQIERMNQRHRRTALRLFGKVSEKLRALAGQDLTTDQMLRALDLAVRVERETLGAVPEIPLRVRHEYPELRQLSDEDLLALADIAQRLTGRGPGDEGAEPEGQE